MLVYSIAFLVLPLRANIRKALLWSLCLKRNQDNILFMTMTVGNMMKKKLETIHEMASVQQTAKEMNEKNVSSLVVVDANGKPQGIVTERDLARRVCINDVSELYSYTISSRYSFNATALLKYTIIFKRNIRVFI